MRRHNEAPWLPIAAQNLSSWPASVQLLCSSSAAPTSLALLISQTTNSARLFSDVNRSQIKILTANSENTLSAFTADDWTWWLSWIDDWILSPSICNLISFYSSYLCRKQQWTLIMNLFILTCSLHKVLGVIISVGGTFEEIHVVFKSTFDKWVSLEDIW